MLSKFGLGLSALLGLSIVFNFGCTTNQTPATKPSVATPTTSTATTPSVSGSPAASLSTPTATSVSAPKAGATAIPATRGPSGELRVASSGFKLDKIDPATVSGAEIGLLGANLDYLMTVAPSGGPAPGLAESWQMSPDGKTWTLSLRKGVKFHDGSDLTAEDVKFSFMRTIATDSKSTNSGYLRRTVAGVEASNPSTVLFRLNVPDPEFWSYLGITKAGSEGTVIPKKIVEEKGIDSWNERPIGSGPWKFVKKTPGYSWEFEANESYWGKVPEFKTFKLMSVPDEATRIAMLKSGEVDVIELGSTDAAAQVKGAGFAIGTVALGANTMLSMWGAWDQSLPIGDLRVRQAMSLAVNRVEMAEKLYGGFAQPAPIYMASPLNDFFDPKVLTPVEYNPDKAKALLAQAGHPNGFEITLLSTQASGVNLPIMVEAVTGYWQKIGIKAKIEPIDYGVLSAQWRERPIKALLGKAFVMRMSSPITTFSLPLVYHSNSVTGMMRDQAIDAMIDKAAATVDPAERKKLALQAAAAARDTNIVIPMLYHDVFYGLGKKVGSFTATPGTTYLHPYIGFTQAR